MAVANTLAYYLTATITAVKSFIVQAPEVSKSVVNVHNYCPGKAWSKPSE
jgi:hypothetical protein